MKPRAKIDSGPGEELNQDCKSKTSNFFNGSGHLVNEEVEYCEPLVIAVIKNKSENESDSAEPFYCDPAAELELQKEETLDIKKSVTGCRKYLGFVLILLSGIFLTLSSLIVKYMSRRGYHTFVLAFYRFQGIFLPSVLVLIYVQCVRNTNVFEPVWPLTEKRKLKNVLLLLIRCICGCLSLLGFFFSVVYISVADSLVIGSCNAVFVTFVACIFLQEKCNVFPILMAILTIIGIGILARPPILTGEKDYDNDTLIGVSLAVAYMIISTFVIVILRYLRKLNFALITFTYGTIGTVVNLICVAVIGAPLIPETTQDFLFALGLALLTFFGQVCFTIALKCEQAGPVSLARNCYPVLAFVWQYMFFGIIPDAYSISGAILVIVGVSLIAFRKWLSGLPENHQTRRIFFFVLK